MSVSIEMQEWQTAAPATHSHLANLALPEDNAMQQLIEQLSTSGQLKIIEKRQGLVLETSSYVGRITLGDVQVTIRPKIQMMPLLRLMQYAYGLRQLDLSATATFDVEASSFQDLLIYQLANEVSDLLTRGLQRQYVRKQEQLGSPRGRVDVQRLARQGGIMQATLPCMHYLRLEDSLLNQVLLAGIRFGVRLANDDVLRLKLQHLEHFYCSEISAVKLNWHLLSRVRQEMNRLTTAYAPILTLIEILLASTGISLGEQYQALHLPGFLFDMNMFFQHLLTRFLQEHLSEYEVQDQYSLDSIMRYSENPRKRRPPALRPDYVIWQKGKIVAILDAKYRDLWQKELPPHMLYQLIMYAIGQEHCTSATILYPTTTSDAQDARIEMRIPAHQQGKASVVLRPVDVLQLDALLSHEGTRDNKRERINFARQLILKV
ncbi:hypothetical protein KSF_065340 [Reticulibacter mediterranei]|uniref:Restriction endonuclease n=1 Tax=Reticulibacter mediterranei TaxID=2778369 RepID=A0A8J3IW98_9CHLR|nr:McrC family protein [Reticulibacter mediterranei]GHO96486.1 hypothetical protein KSF_065340 [Reticulibacter mediterranei]